MLIHFHPCDHITFELKHLHVFEIIIVLEKKLARLTVVVSYASFFICFYCKLLFRVTFRYRSEIQYICAFKKDNSKQFF